jgi:hypothetical protein
MNTLNARDYEVGVRDAKNVLHQFYSHNKPLETAFTGAIINKFNNAKLRNELLGLISGYV